MRLSSHLLNVMSDTMSVVVCSSGTLCVVFVVAMVDVGRFVVVVFVLSPVDVVDTVVIVAGGIVVIVVVVEFVGTDDNIDDGNADIEGNNMMLLYLGSTQAV